MAAIATVQMRIPDPPPLTKRVENLEEISARARELIRSGLLKFWDPEEHPRAGGPPNAGWFTPVSDKPERLEPIPGIENGDPTDKPGEWSPSEAGEYRGSPPGIVELPLPGGSPRPAGSSPAPTAPVQPRTGPKPPSAYGSATDMSSGQSLPPKIGSFPVPDNLTYGTTPFGYYAHDAIAGLLERRFPNVDFILRIRPGQRGVDVEVPERSISDVGHQYFEIKPLTPSGERSFYRQLEEWGVGPVQSLTYDKDGNIYYGFR